MHTYILPHSHVMEPFFSESKDSLGRGDTRTERKGYNFPKKIIGLMERLEHSLDVSSETRVIEKAVEMMAKRLPVLSEIHCGNFQDIQPSEIEDWKALGDLLRYREGDYLLRASGDAVTGGPIEENDLVLIRPQASCDNNDIAAILLNTPTGKRPVLKRVRFTFGSPKVSLLPLGEGTEIVVDTDKEPLEICGVTRGIIKTD